MFMDDTGFIYDPDTKHHWGREEMGYISSCREDIFPLVDAPKKRHNAK